MTFRQPILALRSSVAAHDLEFAHALRALAEQNVIETGKLRVRRAGDLSPDAVDREIHALAILRDALSLD